MPLEKKWDIAPSTLIGRAITEYIDWLRGHPE